MIEIIAQPQGWSAEEVERYVTIPLENGLIGMPDLEHIRSQSLFGLSDVKCYFAWDAELRTAQQRVLNRLSFVNLPPGMSPQLSPWSAIGELYRYMVRGQRLLAGRPQDRAGLDPGEAVPPGAGRHRRGRLRRR